MKLQGTKVYNPYRYSRPPRGGRGLKLLLVCCSCVCCFWSPPSRGAWIEMLGRSFSSRRMLWSPPSRGAWIEMSESSSASGTVGVAPLAGGVD